MEKMFRLLRADEIDARVATINEKGCSLLLYKDSRVDQNLLDQTVGPMNWQRRHSRDNANCEVGIWDESKKMWVWKEDTGTESYTEKEKGLASDSFKRACFNWGIGRELYTAPFIWVNKNDVNIIKGDNGKCKTFDHFTVKRIEYDGDRISKLEIVNDKTKKVVFSMGMLKSAEPSAEKKPDPIDLDQITKIKKLCESNAMPESYICGLYKISTLKSLSKIQADAVIREFDRFVKKYEEDIPFK